MVRPMLLHVHDQISFSPVPLAIGLFVSVSILVALCAKHAGQIPKKHTSNTSEPNAPKSPLPSPKKLIAAISHKAMMMPLVIHCKKSAQETDTGVGDNNKGKEEIGLWQKAILMGERCQPPEFSGVIYYDYSGNRIPEMPMSPRASPMISPLRNFSFPVDKRDKSMSIADSAL
ncbi:hypothetical protein BUALT_Bualt05G0132700 [Buddleja alternifolia]|uniref:Uncharacterized protein n=1 Tax=Buddleja alternifolia TaxID=168488 RepID=A0AAV6XIU8_9LAMI|nr:hypothetical protein BUALT_Bualt05G0132700 [Buddleja alternifolia]